MHACAAALIYRRERLVSTSNYYNNTQQQTTIHSGGGTSTAPTSTAAPQPQKLGKTETKLLYTLHWLILDAAAECEDNAAQNKNKHHHHLNQHHHQQQETYLHSVATIQLFVYLFVPILDSLNAGDLDNLKLANGLQIWEPLWSHRMPQVKIFNTTVRQSRVKSADELTNAGSTASMHNAATAQVLLPSAKINVPQAIDGFEIKQNGSIYMGKIDEQTESRVWWKWMLFILIQCKFVNFDL